MSLGLIIDLFCGAGGAAKGYHDAGFEVVGIDLHPQPRYPYDFIQGDAIAVMKNWLKGFYDWSILDKAVAFHASPPCQFWSRMSKCVPGTAEKYPKLIAPTRKLLKATGLPYAIENVTGAPLIDPVVLCGTSFGMRIKRHRLFEANFWVPKLGCKHNGYAMNPHSTAGRKRIYEEFGRGDPEKVWAKEMGIDWPASRREVREAIPPKYTEYIGHYLAQHLTYRREYGTAA